MLPHDNPNNIPRAKFSDVATAKSRENNKVLKYKKHGIISDHNGQVVPIACETLGKMGKMGFDYISQAAQEYGKDYKVNMIKRYWFRKISIALQSFIGQAVELQLRELISGEIISDDDLQYNYELFQRMGCRIQGITNKKDRF